MKNSINQLYKLTLTGLIIFCLSHISYSQSITTRSFTVNGDFDKFYPVVFTESNWNDGATELEISRSSVHINSLWRGSMIAKFRIHTTQWGNKCNFIDVDLRTYINSFIADWNDATFNNGGTTFIIWFRGGGTAYFFRSINSTIGDPLVYDGIQNGLPYQEINGPAHNYKTDVNPNINQNGVTYSGSAIFVGNNVVQGNILIGKTSQSNTSYKLDVAGKIRADEIVVNTTGADFVFENNYKLRPLSEVETFIKQNKHLPDVAPAKEMQTNGVSMGDMQTKLLQKVEELTLYVIEQDKKLEKISAENEKLKAKIIQLENK